MKKIREFLKNHKRNIGAIALVLILGGAVCLLFAFRSENEGTVNKTTRVTVAMSDMDISFDEEDLTARGEGEPTEESLTSEATEESETSESDKVAEENETGEEDKDSEKSSEKVESESEKSTSSVKDSAPNNDGKKDSITTVADKTTVGGSADRVTTEKHEETTANQEEDPSEIEINVTEITEGGDYVYSGEIREKGIVIDAGQDEVYLIFRGVDITNTKGPCVRVISAAKVYISLAAGTVNSVSDGSSYSIVDGTTNVDSAIFSKSSLTVNGSGTLNVSGNYKHGIVSKQELVIASSTLKIKSKNVGIYGKDWVKISGANINISSGTDAIRTANIFDPTRGFVVIDKTTLTANSTNDGIQAITAIKLSSSTVNITSGGGSGVELTATGSYKGIKAGSDIEITNCNMDIDSRDDCINGGGSIVVDSGDIACSTGDDGIHADTNLEICGSGKLSIDKCYEGLEASSITISGGSISIDAEDDAIKAGGGTDSTAGDSFSSYNGSICITAGSISINASGDGIDVSGLLDISGGSISISGKGSGNASILDYEQGGKISGGSFIGLGSSQKSVNFSSAVNQAAVLIKTESYPSGTQIKVTDSSGRVIVDHTAEKDFTCVLLSNMNIQKGNTYTIHFGSETKTFTVTNEIYGD